jgi:hypothetical protein
MLHNTFLLGSKFAGSGRDDVARDAEIDDKSEFRRRILFRLTLVVAAVLIWLIILVNLLPS